MATARNVVPIEATKLMMSEGPLSGKGLRVVQNLVPTSPTGYRIFAGIGTPTASAMDTAARGSICLTSGSTDYIYVGTTGRLYQQISGGALSNLSQGGGTPYATSATDWGWSFTQWGNGVIATNYVDHVQYKADFTAAAAFIDLITSTTKPKARYMGGVKNQLVVAYTNEGGTAYPHRVRWSAVDNALSFDASAATQSDYQDLLDDYGEIKGFAGGDYGLVFKERAIYKMSYVGSPLIYRFDVIVAGLGTIYPGSIIEHGGEVYFWANNGLYAIDKADKLRKIDDGVVSHLVAARDVDGSWGWYANLELLSSAANRIYARVEPSSGSIWWQYDSSDTTTIGTHVVAYNPMTDKASICVPYSSAGVKMQWLIGGPAVVSSDPQVSPSTDRFYAVDSAKKVTDFTGEAEADSLIHSPVIALPQGERVEIRSVRPLAAGPNPGNKPANDVKVVVLDHCGAILDTVNFSASTRGSGWWRGTVNGEYLAVRTTFTNTAGAEIAPAFFEGWQVDLQGDGGGSDD